MWKGARFSQAPIHFCTLAGTTAPQARLPERGPQHHVGHREFVPNEPGALPESRVHGAEHGGLFFTASLFELKDGCVHPAVHEGQAHGVLLPAKEREQEAGDVAFAFDGTHGLDTELHLRLGHVLPDQSEAQLVLVPGLLLLLAEALEKVRRHALDRRVRVDRGQHPVVVTQQPVQHEQGQGGEAGLALITMSFRAP